MYYTVFPEDASEDSIVFHGVHTYSISNKHAVWLAKSNRNTRSWRALLSQTHPVVGSSDKEKRDHLNLSSWLFPLAHYHWQMTWFINLF